MSSTKLEINFTLCHILELQDLGGREKWEQILAETDQPDQTQHARRTVTKVASLLILSNSLIIQYNNEQGVVD